MNTMQKTPGYDVHVTQHGHTLYLPMTLLTQIQETRRKDIERDHKLQGLFSASDKKKRKLE